MAKHQTKVRLICSAPSELTKYNKTWNAEVEEKCIASPKFEPAMACLHCQFLTIKTYAK